MKDKIMRRVPIVELNYKVDNKSVYLIKKDNDIQFTTVPLYATRFYSYDEAQSVANSVNGKISEIALTGTLYLTYVVYNLNDGHDTDNIGIFDDFESAKKVLLAYIEANELDFNREEKYEITTENGPFAIYAENKGEQMAGIASVDSYLDL